MANPKGIITRRDIIEDEALKFGEVYAENVKEAIKQNKILVESVKELNKQVQAFKVANSQKDYITAKQAEALATQKAIDAIKKQEAAEISADKIKRSAIATMEAERRAREATEKAQKRANDEKDRSRKLTIEERVQNEIANKVLRQEALERLGLVSAYTKLNNARTEAKNKLRDLIASESASTAEIKKAQKEFETLDQKVRKADRAVGDFTKNVGNYPLKNITSGLKNLIGAFGVTGGIAAFAGIMKGAYDTVKKFEQGLADLSAITGASGKELDYLKKQAIELGKSTKGGAIAVVEAYKLIGSAKPELLENVKALNQVTEATLTLSKAAGMEMPQAATALTDAMNQFGADASQAAVFVDALAAGAKYGAAEIPQTTEALLQFGAVARTSNISIHESVALIELLAENGIKGAEAGTKLRNVLLKIAAPDALPKEGFRALSQALKESGVSMEYLKDKTVPVEDKLKVLKPLLRDNANIVKIFGDENATAAINIIEHNDRLRELTKSTKEQGVADEQAAIKMDTVQGKTEKLSSTYDSLVLSIGSGSGVVSSFFKILVDGTTEALESLIRFNTSWDELFDKAAAEGEKKGRKLGENLANELIKNGARKNNPIGNLEDGENDIGWQIAAEETKLAELKAAAKKAKKDSWSLGESFDEKAANRALEAQIKYVANLKGQNEAIKDRIELLKNPPKSNSDDTAADTPGETDAERKKRLDKAKKDREDYLKNLKGIDQEEFELEQFRLQRTKELNQEIVDDEKESIDERIASLLYVNQLDIALAESTTRQKLKEISRYDDKVRDLSDNQIEILINGTEAAKEELLKKLDLNNQEILALEQLAAKKEDVQRKQEDKIKKLQDEEAKKILDAFKKRIEDLAKFEKERNAKADEQIIVEQKRFRDKEITQEQYEDRVNKIKRNAAKLAIDDQLVHLNDTDEKKRLLEEEFQKLRKQLSDEQTQEFIEDQEKRNKAIVEMTASLGKTFAVLNNGFGLDTSTLESFFINIASNFDKIKNGGKLSFQAIAESARLSMAVISDISNALLQSKMAGIEAEIAKSDEYYNAEIEKAGNDERKKAFIQKEAAEKRKKLEAEKRKEQQKQAVFEKALTVSQIGLQTALAIIKAAAATAPTFWGVVIAAGIGAIQLGAALATPIPKYKHGRKGGPEELAIVGDGGRREIIERRSGVIEMTPATDTLVKLERGDKVHSSIEEYHKLQRAALLNGIDMQGRKATEYQANIEFEKTYGKELLEELKRNTKAIEKNKSNVIINVPKTDFAHELWKMKNKNWSS